MFEDIFGPMSSESKAWVLIIFSFCAVISTLITAMTICSLFGSPRTPVEICLNGGLDLRNSALCQKIVDNVSFPK